MSQTKSSGNRVMTEGRGRLLTNDKKRSDKSPDFRGDLLYNGELIKMSAWKKQTPYGELISLSVDNWKPENNPDYSKNRDDPDVPF